MDFDKNNKLLGIEIINVSEILHIDQLITKAEKFEQYVIDKLNIDISEEDTKKIDNTSEKLENIIEKLDNTKLNDIQGKFKK